MSRQIAIIAATAIALAVLPGCRRTVHHHHHGVVVHQTGQPPSHAPAHGVRRKYVYHYYPSCEVYYRVDTQMWIWYASGTWHAGASLPGDLRVRLGTRVDVELDDDHPRHKHYEVKVRYRDGGKDDKGGQAHGHERKDDRPAHGHGHERKDDKPAHGHGPERKDDKPAHGHGQELKDDKPAHGHGQGRKDDEPAHGHGGPSKAQESDSGGAEKGAGPGKPAQGGGGRGKDEGPGHGKDDGKDKGRGKDR